jgi:hypothetical protein
MGKKNITLQMDETLLKHSKHCAVEDNMSLSEWVATVVSAAVRIRSGREQARRNALAVLRSPLHLGGKILGREELHER